MSKRRKSANYKRKQTKSLSSSEQEQNREFLFKGMILKFLKKSVDLTSWQFIVWGSIFIWFISCNQLCNDIIFEYKNIFIVLVGILYFTGTFYVCCLKERSNRKISQCIFAGNFLLSAVYVLTVPYTITRHDVGEFMGFETMETSAGHFGYIDYLYKNHSLPDSTHIGLWEFYQPPGFHILGAIVLKITRLFNVAEPICYESLQVITLCFSCLTVWTVYQIIKEFDIDDKWVNYLMIFLMMHPFFSIMTVTLNNDCMAMYLMTLIIWTSIRWSKNPSLKNIIFLSLSLGVGIFVKYNVGIMAIAIGSLFIYSLWQWRKCSFKIIYQFVYFFIICAPIALFWPMRNMIKFDLPFLYNQLMNNINSSQYISGQTLLSCFSIPPLHQFTHAFTIWDPTLERNGWIALIRTSLFDEWQATGLVASCALVLLWVSILLAIFMNCFFIWSIFKKNTIDIGVKVFLFTGYVSLIYSYIHLNLTHPFICHMNYRLVPILMLFSFIGTAIWLQKQQENEMNYIVKCKNGILCCGMAFCMLATFFYIFLISR